MASRSLLLDWTLEEFEARSEAAGKSTLGILQVQELPVDRILGGSLLQ
jgi:hypothetical protein